MATRKRKPAPVPPKPPVAKFRQVIEGEVTIDDDQGVVVWDYIPNEQSSLPAHGFAGGGLIEGHLTGRRVRITIEEL